MKTRTKIMFGAGLLFYGLILFVALTFYRLPVEEILSGAINRMTHGKVFLTAEKRSFSLWKGHRLERLTWTIYAGNSVVTEPMESLTLSPNLFRLFQGYVPVNMKGVLPEGSFKLSVGVSPLRGMSKGYATIETEGIQLETLSILKSLAQREIRGKLMGRFDFYGDLNDLARADGQGTVTIEDGALDVKADALGLHTLPFQRLVIPLTFKNGVADLRDGEIRSPLMTGDLEGQISLHQDLEASPLQLKARIRPGPPPPEGQAVRSPVRGRRPLVIELQGTLGSPLISWTGDLP
jgi:type II secretion system protein N